MRKLGIIIAIAAVATLGFAGRASAQAEAVCDQLQGFADEAEAQDPTPNPLPGGPGTPVKQLVQGGADACYGQDPLQVVCGVGETVEGIIGANPLSDGIDSDAPGCADATGDDDDDDVDSEKKDKKDDPKVEDEVVENNAAPGGTLPRTGGELQLLGGLSMGLTGLGVFARRFLR